MAKKREKPNGAEWTAALDETEVQEARADATVDCYNEYEQHTGLLTAIQDHLEFPFQAKVLGEVVAVVDMEWPVDDEFGLDLVCEHNGERHRVDARSVDLLPPLPDGHLYLAAYLAWKRRL
jgi:hypothetical protein